MENNLINNPSVVISKNELLANNYKIFDCWKRVQETNDQDLDEFIKSIDVRNGINLGDMEKFVSKLKESDFKKYGLQKYDFKIGCSDIGFDNVYYKSL